MAAASVDVTEVLRLVGICKAGFSILAAHVPTFDRSHPFTADEIITLPLDKVRVDDVAAHELPRRRSARAALAAAIASLLYPAPEEATISQVIKYESDRVQLRAWAALQRKYDILIATKRHGRTTFGLSGGVGPDVHAPVWSSRILSQGRWDDSQKHISTDGVKALPMPLAIAKREELAPFFAHLRAGGTHELLEGSEGYALHEGKGEPYYGVKGAEFRKGVVYEDGRMDLCKMGVGPDHIGELMDCLRTNTFIRHFLLGNNLIGPVGARKVAQFIDEFPDRMDTWYLAGNCIDGAHLEVLVDALVKSNASNIWLKRNPLGRDAAHHVYRLITGAKALRTLDLDQTELGDAGVVELFKLLTTHSNQSESTLPLQHLYLNGVGISTAGAKAIASFLVSPKCRLESLYLSCNPLGDAGLVALASALPKAPHLTRLSLQSTGIGSNGAIALFEAVKTHPHIRLVDVGQGFATEDLGQAFNYLDDAVTPAVCDLLTTSKSLEYFRLSYCPITPAKLRAIGRAVAQSSLLYYFADSILADLTVPAPTFVPTSIAPDPFASKGQSKEERDVAEAIRLRLEANVKAKYGESMTYPVFMDEERRWIINDKIDIRKIDSVYRNRDAGLARRKLITLVKHWDEDDTTLERVRKGQAILEDDIDID